MAPALQIGLWVALAYAGFAVFVIASDRRPHRGGWISVSGLLICYSGSSPRGARTRVGLPE